MDRLGGITSSQTLEHALERPSEKTTGRLTRGPVAGTFGATELSYQRYLEEQVRHHLKEVADKARDLVERHQLRHVVLAGDRQVCNELHRLLPKSVQERVIDTLALDPSSPEGVVLRESLQALERKATAEAHRKVGDPAGWPLPDRRPGDHGPASRSEKPSTAAR